MSATTPSTESPGRGGLLSWLIVSSIGVTTLTLLAVNAPPGLKRIGLFAVGFGGVAGWLMGRLARMSAVDHLKSATIAAVVLSAAGTIGMAVESHRQWRQAQDSSEPARAVILARLLDQSAADAAHQEAWQDFRQSLLQAEHARARQTGFLAYLAARCGRREFESWTVAVWIVELLAAAAAGGWVFQRTVASAGTDEQP